MKNIKQSSSMGLLVAGALMVANTANADQVILDDLIVDGSACLGLDCVNGESFGFDTLRLKENNLRIRAFDTSSSASFPTNDWQITFNDSSNGGANKFSIDDIDGGRTPFTIEANAPSHSLFVDDGGRLGFGTNTPVVDLHVKSGNTPTLRLEQDGSSGFTPQIWDLAGNETNFFIRDASNGSTLPFRIFPGAPTSALNIEATTGDVGIGTTSPAEELHIQGAAADTVAMELNNDSSWRIRNQGSGVQDGWLEFRNDDGGVTIPMRIAAGTNNNVLLVGATNGVVADPDRVTINGELFINAAGPVAAPDYVFEPNYELQSIDEHAESMWENKHLPAVGEGKKTINVTKLSYGVLEELEVAHIYISQLNDKIKQLEARLSDLESD